VTGMIAVATFTLWLVYELTGGGIHVGELDPFTFGELNFESHHLGGIFGDVADTFEDEGVLDVGEEATTSKQGLSVISQCGISRDARCLVA